MVLGRWLNVPNVARIAVQLARLESLSDVFSLADRAAGRIHEPCALLEVLEQVFVDKAAGAFVKRRVDGLK